MEQKDREKIAARLAKIKQLAEKGVGGEKETALRMYEELKAKYDITDDEVNVNEVKVRWFSYSTEIDRELLLQIFYKVTGDASSYAYKGRYSRRKKCGVECTEIEAAEITLLYNFYKNELEKQIRALMIAFKSVNDLYPDKTARCYEERDDEQEEQPELTEEEQKIMQRAAAMGFGMDKAQPPRVLIRELDEEEGEYGRWYS